MASTKYIGYLGGAAVAAGVGAAIAVAGAATASAETTDSAAKAEPAKTEHSKPLEKLTDRIEKVTAQVTKATKPSATKPSTVKPSTVKATDAEVSATQIVVKKPKPTPQQFEAEQVERLKGLFQPRETAQSNDTVETKAAAQIPHDPNPFRENDPEPVDIPEPVEQIKHGLMDAVGPQLAPFVREGVEQVYRGSQMIPWVNAVVPVTKIVPAIGAAIGGDTAASQQIINELIKTTPPGSFLYYGYDLVADLANQEDEAQALKEQAFAGVWDLLDPLGILHPPGEPGIGSAL